MVKRTKMILLILVLGVLAISCAAFSLLRSNYTLGQELYHSSNDTLHQILNLAKSLGYLGQAFSASPKRSDDVGRHRAGTLAPSTEMESPRKGRA